MVPLGCIAQGEELRKQIGALYYIECSSKTQQVLMCIFIFDLVLFSYKSWIRGRMSERFLCGVIDP